MLVVLQRMRGGWGEDFVLERTQESCGQPLSVLSEGFPEPVSLNVGMLQQGLLPTHMFLSPSNHVTQAAEPVMHASCPRLPSDSGCRARGQGSMNGASVATTKEQWSLWV